MTKRVLFLISDTGGGHRASAEALKQALARLHGPAVTCAIVDPFARYAHWPLSRVPHSYTPLISRYLWLWQGLWQLSASPTAWRAASRAVAAWQSGPLRQLASDHPADLAVSVHPLLCRLPQRTLRAVQPGIRLATVVTDLDSAPRLWFEPNVDLLVAPCEQVVSAARAAGLPAGRIQRLGLPIRLEFLDAPASQAEARARLGLADRPTVLVMGGGEGMGGLEGVVDALASGLHGQPAQIAVVCGRNAALRQHLAARRWPTPVTALGFVDDIPVWMRAADCLVTKAGPGAIAEALACTLPMVLSSFVPGQETGNVAFVERNGLGVYRPDRLAMAATVRGWLAEPELLVGMRQRARLLARPRAALDIAEALSALLD